ncbi:MAG: hypothetical protein EXS01_06270 [Phycisphaerales bacterium]|nr:hypothetical protein [Phycisphaerales bacterium]
MISRLSAAIASVMLVSCSIACESTRTVHVKRGAGMLGLEGAVGTETILADGSRVVVVNELPTAQQNSALRGKHYGPPEPPPDPIAGMYSSGGMPPPPPPKPEPPKELELREVARDGTVTLRAIMPEHVMAHFVEALKSREYGPFYEQMLASDARQSYERAGGEQAFIEWAEKNREGLLTFLNRMSTGWSGTAVLCERVSTMRLRYRLDKRNISDIRFEFVEIQMERGGSRLAMVH